MAEIINTADLTPYGLDDSRSLWVYNGLDCCLTKEIMEAIYPQVQADHNVNLTYDFLRATQAPAMEMQLRGIHVDENERRIKVLFYRNQIERIKFLLNWLTKEALGWALDKRGWRMNPFSPQKMNFFFYKMLKLPEVKIWDGTKSRVTVNRDALESFLDYPDAEPFARMVMAARDIGKKLSFLHTGMDQDGRMRVSFKVAGTETLRWSSSKNCYRRGTNNQNVTDEMRRIFVADEGMKFAYCDLSSAESYAMGYAAQDQAYIDAIGTGDVHTAVAKMVWPELDWTDDPAHNKKVAKVPFYRHHSYRDMAKKLGHGCNYVGTAYTMAKETKIPIKVVENFMNIYFGLFPKLRAYHHWIAQELQTTGTIITPLGVRRRFLGRRDDPATLREAVAFVPQSSVATILNLGMWKVWQADIIALMSQLHDAILIQYPEEQEDEILPQVLDLMRIPVTIHGQEMCIPIDAKVGWNWEEQERAEEHGLDNPDGLAKWSGNDTRTRQIPFKTPIMDLVLF